VFINLGREGLILSDANLLQVCEVGDLGSLAYFLAADRHRVLTTYNEAFNVAAERGYKDLALLLLNNVDHLDPSTSDQKAIREAAKNGHTKGVKLLLRHPKVDPSYFSNYALRFASSNGHHNVVELLLADKRVDPTSQFGVSLIEASKNGHKEVVRLLLEDKRADPLSHHYLALIEALKYGREEVVLLLLEAKPLTELSQQQLEGIAGELVKALEIAKKTGHQEFIENLLKSGKIPESIFTQKASGTKLPNFGFSNTQNESDSTESSSTSEEVAEKFNLNIHCFQHIPSDHLGAILPWIESRGYKISITKVWEGESFPEDILVYDWLIVLGGTMIPGANDDDKYEWMPKEKKLIRQAIDANKVVLGICLGSQLIASALGKEVRKHKHQEVGWFPLKLTPEGSKSPFSRYRILLM